VAGAVAKAATPMRRIPVRNNAGDSIEVIETPMEEKE
jgi:hypothetical protein